MHTKEELVEKKSKSQQLDLVEEVSAVDIVAKKRKYLFLAILATIGLSIFFWLFRISQYYFAHPSDLIPKVSLTIPRKIGSPLPPQDIQSILELQINQIITQNPDNWNISLLIDDQAFNWSKNKKTISVGEFESIKNTLVVKKNGQSKISAFLPQGLNVKENFFESLNTFSIQSLVTIPKHQIIYFISYTGENLHFPPPSFPELISSLYWSVAPTLTE